MTTLGPLKRLSGCLSGLAVLYPPLGLLFLRIQVGGGGCLGVLRRLLFLQGCVLFLLADSFLKKMEDLRCAV